MVNIQKQVNLPNYHIINHFKLTKREFDCLVMTMYGYSYKKAAQLLSISDRTVEMNVRHIRSKLKINHRNQITDLLRRFHNNDFLRECAEHLNTILKSHDVSI